MPREGAPSVEGLLRVTCGVQGQVKALAHALGIGLPTQQQIRASVNGGSDTLPGRAQLAEARRVHRAASMAVGDARQVARPARDSLGIESVRRVASALGVAGRRDLIGPQLDAIERAIAMLDTTIKRIETIERITLDDRTGPG